MRLHQVDCLTLAGAVLGVSSDAEHRFSKAKKDCITLIEGHGVEGDAHGGEYIRHRFLARRWSRLPNRRQVHIIPSELFVDLREAGHTVAPGELGENITTQGLTLEPLPLGTRLHLGHSAVVELTGLRTPCVLIDRFQKGLRSRMVRGNGTEPKFKCGVLGIVTAGGQVSPGETVRVETPLEPWSPLPAM
jgi:hypothetical protein